MASASLACPNPDRSASSSLQEIECTDAFRFPFLHLCDAEVCPVYTEHELQRTAREDRLIPGNGAIPLFDIVTRCPPDVPIAQEIPIANRSVSSRNLNFAHRIFGVSRTFIDRLGRPGSPQPERFGHRAIPRLVTAGFYPRYPSSRGRNKTISGTKVISISAPISAIRNGQISRITLPIGAPETFETINKSKP